MSLELKPYPEYKDSGLPWLGEIPPHWKTQSLKRIARLNPSKSEARDVLDRNEDVTFLPMEKVGSDGRIDAGEQRPVASVWNGFTYFQKNDVLLAKITPCFENGKGACLTCLPTAVGFGSTEFTVLRPRTTVTSQFLYRITSLARFRQLGADEMTGSAGQQRVPNEFVGNFVTPVPPISEQERIVSFLDRVDGLVNRLIRAKQRMIELLNEQKQTVIHHAVTRGLDPDAPMKPTGLDWLPEVPEHWKVIRAKHLFREVDVRAESGEEELLSVSHISGVTPRNQKNVTMFTAKSNMEHKMCRPNDLVVNTMWAWMGALGVARHEGLVSPSYAVYRPAHLDHLDPRYADRLLRTRQYVDEYNRKSTGIHSSRLRLYPDQFLRIGVLLPPIGEQEQILRTVEEEERTIDTTIRRAHREIELIREYRTRLVSDVVTGKLDVRGVELPEPEEGVGADFVGLESVATVGLPDPEEVQDVALRHQ